MSSEDGDGIDTDVDGESTPDAPPEQAYEASQEYVGDPQEMWIEEYEREGRRPKREREKPRRIGRWIILAAVIIILVVWTLISPSIMSTAGTTYVSSDEYANLGSETSAQDVQVLASVVTAGTTTWGISIAGDSNATVDEDAVFQVMVSKVSEERGGFWFMGTDISLRNVSMYLDDDTLIGWMVEKQEQDNRSVGTVHASFDDTGVFDCYIVLRFSVYEVMRIGFLPADKVVATMSLSDSIIVSERAEIGPTA
ncbi:MAG: hypothetical protein JSV90_08420 [Methanobacteriota archaeon]|nr:MAG: hypothetical protein JSV90_08420 [Euryarchaeota archaeon]